MEMDGFTSPSCFFFFKKSMRMDLDDDEDGGTS